jgi:DNA topoisomerase III
VAKSVAEILSLRGGGGMRVRNGRSRYNRVFEFEYMIRNQRCLMVVTSVTGHLMELDFDERYKRWASCDPAALYQAPVRKFVPQVYATFYYCALFECIISSSLFTLPFLLVF